MMKRMYRIVLAAALCLALALPVFAETIYEGEAYTLTQTPIDVEARAKDAETHYEFEAFNNGLARIYDYTLMGGFFPMSGNYGFIDRTGALVIPQQYENAGDFSEGVAWVSENGKVGAIDTAGKRMVPFRYEALGDCSEGLMAACRDGKWGYINKRGNVIIPFKWDFAGEFSGGLARVGLKDGVDEDGNETGKLGFIDKKGKTVIPVTYPSCGDFSEGLAPVKIGESYGYMDKEGKVVIAAEYDAVSDFQEGLAAVMKDEKVGYINPKGKPVIPLQYVHAFDFSEGLAVVITLDEQDGYRCQVIDPKGNVVIDDGTSTQIGGFHDGIAWADLATETGTVGRLIDAAGVTLDSGFVGLWDFSEGLAVASRIDDDGNITHYVLEKTDLTPAE